MYDMGTGTWSIKPGDGGVAKGHYEVQQNQTGWNTLHVYTDGSYSDALQSYGAGFLEGYLTMEDIWNTWLTCQQTISFDDKVTSFMLAQDKWVREMAKSQTDGYWHQVQLVLSQLDGLLASYSMYAPQERQISYTDFMYMVLMPEVSDIQTYTSLVARRAAGERVEEVELPDGPPPIGEHCSVLVKASLDGANLLAAHDTWSSYTNMLRLYKYYHFNFNHPSTKVYTIAFSSYAANLQSTDDYYVLDNQMVVAETTNEVFNNSLYLNYFSEETVPEWIRVIVANRMADSGLNWVSAFSKYNSGTYNNQWQVIDYKLFVPGKPIQPGTLWIAEQIPGFVFSADKSDFLANGGFWPSYNIPYFIENYNISGYPSLFEKYGNTYSYQNCARAQIFRRDAGKVQTLQDLKRIMRYNEYQTDPLSLQDACRSISARCDLNTPWTANPLNEYSAFGAIDSKVTDASLVKDLKSWIVSGPAWDSQPPFAWTNQWKGVPRFGMPDVYAFPFILSQPIF
eukprot:TRINITY_DN1490_c0_g1_i1.p1 TRINITY_DN1490_c0_g1~~TRINITY_DN1490_c0_g1_i1.p1  ORF type:complete len:540 (+),score=100.73 TRINITY_DN1490_c0_g1_i1:93-1622(+)